MESDLDLRAVTVVLPALDEAAALPSALASFPAGVDLVVVDNGSTDGTAAVAAALGARVVHEPRRGFGAACWAGVQAAPHAEVIAFADADGSFDGADLAGVAGPVLRREADLVLGSRVRGQRDPGALSRLALLENRALGLACGLLFGLPLSDLGPFRALRRDTLLCLGIADRGQGWPLEMVARAALAGLRVIEVPVRYRPRAGGASKVGGSLRGSILASAHMAGVARRLLAEQVAR
jgi:glycosyltransferase involved in cell wall biosynthesis